MRVAKREQHRALFFLLRLDVETNTIVPAYLGYVLHGIGGNGCLFQHHSSRIITSVVQTRSFAQSLQFTQKLFIIKARFGACPHLGGHCLQRGQHAIMHILVADAITHDVVPHSKRTSLYLFMAFGKLHSVDVGGCPLVVKLLRVEVIVVIASLRHDVNLTIGDAHKVISQLHHLVGLGVIVRPREHQHIFHLDRCCAFGVRLLTPHHRLTVVFLHQTDIMVGKSTELLHHILVFVRVFVCSHMHVFTAEHGVFAF